ncbi:MAG: pyridoxamine 5'-phosphate oxidase family protein [Bacteroidota bacterium]
MTIETVDQLREHYAQPSGRAKDKALRKLEEHSINFIAKSPFMIMSTIDKEGNMDSSPRGGKEGFIKVIDEKTIAIPDAKGNNRLDSITNIVESGRIATLFFIPGMDETLRINGKAMISIDPAHLAIFEGEKNPIKACILVTVEEMFLHCAKSIMRAGIWNPETYMDRKEMPTMGRMLNDQLKIEGEVETQAAMVERYKKDL